MSQGPTLFCGSLSYSLGIGCAVFAGALFMAERISTYANRPEEDTYNCTRLIGNITSKALYAISLLAAAYSAALFIGYIFPPIVVAGFAFVGPPTFLLEIARVVSYVFAAFIAFQVGRGVVTCIVKGE